jgi:hypothetical protein
MLPGKYVLAMAVASTDLQKVGVEYYEFVLPEPGANQGTLETPDIFIAKEMKSLPEVEKPLIIHRGMFVYVIYQIEPYVDGIVPPGANIELLFPIFGATAKVAEPGQRPVYDIEVAYDVTKDDPSLAEDQKLAIRWAIQKYDFSLVSQPLPLKQTVIIKDDKGERQEQRDLPAGKYILEIKIKDNVSGLTLDKSVPFEVK